MGRNGQNSKAIIVRDVTLLILMGSINITVLIYALWNSAGAILAIGRGGRETTL